MSKRLWVENLTTCNFKLFRKRIYILVLVCIVVLSSLALYSTEWVRSKLMEFYLDRQEYETAEEIGMKILRKRSMTRSLDSESVKTISVKWDNAMTPLIEREASILQKEWNSTRIFFTINRTIPDKLDTKCRRVQALLTRSLLEELNACKRLNKVISSLMPYPVETGYLENDVNLGSGSLSFNCSGGFALDYNLRSIGANLGSKKSVAAIRLRRWADETRVKPENLSVWISNDNKHYQRVKGEIIFAKGNRAMTLDHLDLQCQYVKVHCNFKDDKYTFAEDFKKIIEIYGPPDFGQIQ